MKPYPTPVSPTSRKAAGLLLACLAGALLLLAPPRSSAAPAASAAPEYRVQPGDTLEITLWNDDNNVQTLKVDADGTLSYPLVGALPVTGLTVAQVETRLAEALKKYVKQPHLTVTLKGTHPQMVYLFGAVAKPGVYEFVEGMRLKDLIGIAGGLAPGADGSRATLTRPDKGPTPLDLDALLKQGQERANIAVGPGDILTVPGPAQDLVTVFILGQVTRPGSLQIARGSRLSDALTVAGGPTPFAALKNASLSRAGLSATVDLEAILRRGDLTGNRELQDGDVLVIPEARNQVTLVGEFQKPGSYPFRDGDRVADAIALGGGPTLQAALQRALLRRAGKETPVDLKSILKQGLPAENQLLQDGDVLVVPSGWLQVTLLGEFQKAGTYPLQEGGKLGDAIAAGGGTTPFADLRHAQLKRAGQDVAVDLYALMNQGAMANNLPLQDGDVLVVPRLRRQVTLLGEFNKTGTYPFEEGDALTVAYGLGGGATVEADLARAVLKRGAQEIPVNLKALLEEGDTRQNRTLEDGDTLYIPQGTRILTYGAFQKPGPVTITEEMRLVDVVLAAGGTAPAARLNEARVVRMADGKPTVTKLDLRAAIERGGKGADFQFQRGDVLFLPAKTGSLSWQSLSPILSLASSAAWLLR